MYSSTKSTKKINKRKKIQKVVGTNRKRKKLQKENNYSQKKYQIYLENVVLHLRDMCILVLKRKNIYRTDKNYKRSLVLNC